MIIRDNASATNAENHLRISNYNLSRSMEKLSSGKRINKAADDASGLAISEKMVSQYEGLKRASMNAYDDISFIQTAEGYLRNTLSMLKRLRYLSVQSANGVLTEEDRSQIQIEAFALISEIDRIAETAQFNTLNMLTGRYAKSETTSQAEDVMWFHIGANMDQRIKIYIDPMTSAALGLKDEASEEATLSLMTADNSNKAIGDIDLAIKKVNAQLSNLGAYQNRLEFAIEGLMTGYENLKEAESKIRNANMAEESIELFKQQILLQTSAAMLSQANIKSQVVTRLINQ